MKTPAVSSLKDSTQTLGILISSTDDKFENALLRGISDAAIQAGANWICFTSGAIRSYHGFESQRNMLDAMPQRTAYDQPINYLRVDEIIKHIPL